MSIAVKKEELKLEDLLIMMDGHFVDLDKKNDKIILRAMNFKRVREIDLNKFDIKL